MKLTFLEKIVENPKGTYALAIFIIIILVVYFVFKNQITAIFQNLKTQLYNKQVLDEQISQTGETLSYSSLTYETFSQQLLNAMKGLGTDDAAIKRVFYQMKNTADVLKLISTFGVREGENLAEWLHGEAPWYEFGSIVKQVNSILASKNINYQF